MPLTEINIDKNTRIFLWKATESIDFLIDKYNLTIEKDFYKMKSLLHRKQYIAKMVLIKILKLDGLIYKNEAGKPFLKNDKFISISHSGLWVGIAISQQSIGLDIEKSQEKLVRISKKFMHKDDFGFQDKMDEKKLVWYWTAKESIYKLIGKRGLSFKEDIRIDEIDKNNSLGKAFIKKYDCKIDVFYKKIADNYILALSKC